MLRLAFDFIITWRETRTRPNAYVYSILETTALPLKADGMPTDGNGMYQVKISLYAIAK